LYPSNHIELDFNENNKNTGKKLLIDYKNENLIKYSNDKNSRSSSNTNPNKTNNFNNHYYEDPIGKKMANLDMNNNDVDEILKIFK
jgi:hypothetical protein